MEGEVRSDGRIRGEARPRVYAAEQSSGAPAPEKWENISAGRKSHGATRIYEAAITGKRRLFRATEQFPCFVEPHAAALGLKPQGCCWQVCILEGRLCKKPKI
jgi:hypothetical protein